MLLYLKLLYTSDKGKELAKHEAVSTRTNIIIKLGLFLLSPKTHFPLIFLDYNTHNITQ